MKHIWVDSERGDDANDGSWGRPLKNIPQPLPDGPLTVHITTGSWWTSKKGPSFGDDRYLKKYAWTVLDG